jgi:hypothetical protein
MSHTLGPLPQPLNQDFKERRPELLGFVNAPGVLKNLTWSQNQKLLTKGSGSFHSHMLDTPLWLRNQGSHVLCYRQSFQPTLVV